MSDFLNERPVQLSQKALSAQIRNVYRVFAKYEIEAEGEACPHCAHAGFKALFHRPIRHLTAAELQPYSFKALTTWGDLANFKRFLPRLFELLALRGFDRLDPEILFSKLTYAGWGNWPDQEQRAIQAYFHALWQAILNHPGSETLFTPADSLLCGLGQAENDLAPYLSLWQAQSSADAAAHLAAFILQNIAAIQKKGALSNPYWQTRSDQMGQVLAWLLDIEVQLDFLARPAVISDPDLRVHLDEAFRLLPVRL